MKATKKKVVSKAVKEVEKGTRRRPYPLLAPPHTKTPNWRIIDKAVKEVLEEMRQEERQAKAK